MTDTTHRAAQAGKELRETEAAFDAVRATMIKTLVESPLGATAQRESLYLGVQALDAVRKALRQVVDAGTVAEASLAVSKNFKPV